MLLFPLSIFYYTVILFTQVKSVYANTRLAGVPNDYQPKKKCHLQKIQRKDPVEGENNYHGPNYMSTETAKQFVDKPLNGPQGKTILDIRGV